MKIAALRLLAASLVVLLLGACGEDNKVGSDVDLGIKSQVEQQRLGARTTTTTAIATTVPPPAGKAGVGEASTTTTTARPVATTAAPTTTTTAQPQERVALEIGVNGDNSGTSQFDPSAARVYVGSLVKWTNNDSQPRSIEADGGEFSSGTLQPGQSFTFRAAAAGKFNYHDGTRPYAVASLEVLPR